jgi:ATP-dependent DNA helicase RecQ
VSHIVRVLTGSQENNILRYRHHLLSTYGIIQDYDQSSIKTFIYELIQQGHLKQTEDQYGVLSLTAKSSGVLKGKEKVFLIKPRERVIHTTEKAEES